MITLTAKIDILKENGKITSISGNGVEKNNISVQGLNDVKNTRKIGSNPFLLGISKLGSGATLSSGENYFIAKKTKNVDETYTITIEGENLTAVTIVFDDYNNQYPQTIVFDNADGTITYTNNNPIFTLTFTPTKIFTLNCSNFTKPEYPLVIYGIYADLSIKIGLNALLNVESNKTDRNNINLPSYGIISNSGLLDFIDKNGEVKEYAEQLLLKGGLKTEISISNTLVKNPTKSEIVSIMYTNEWTYNNKNKNVSVSLKDDLEEWQEIYVDGLYYDAKNEISMSGQELYKHLLSKTPQKYQMLPFEELDENTKNYLSNVVVKFPLIEQGTLWSQWSKFCEAFQSYIYKNNLGQTECYYDGGN